MRERHHRFGDDFSVRLRAKLLGPEPLSAHERRYLATLLAPRKRGRPRQLKVDRAAIAWSVDWMIDKYERRGIADPTAAALEELHKIEYPYADVGSVHRYYRDSLRAAKPSDERVAQDFRRLLGEGKTEDEALGALDAIWGAPPAILRRRIARGNKID